MSISKIIELKQLDNNTSVISNGNYECVINGAEIEMKEGDQLTMKNCFIDTTAVDSANIILTDDIEVHITFQRFTCYNVTYPPANMFNGDDNYAPPASGLPLFETNLVTPDPNNLVLTSITVGPVLIPPAGATHWGGGTVSYTYDDWSDKLQYGSFKLPLLSLAKDANYVKTVELHAKKSSFGNNTPQAQMTKMLLFPLFQIKNAGLTTPTYTPITDSAFITIPAGNYSPADMAGIISEDFQKARNGEFIYARSSGVDPPDGVPVKNNLLRRCPMSELCGAELAEGIDGNDSGALNVVVGKGSTTRWTGTSQFALQYDDTLKKFFFSDIHMPVYDDNGKIIISAKSRTWANQPTSGTAQEDMVADYDYYEQISGGILFTNLHANVVGDKNNLFDFWDKILGFNVEDLIFRPTFKSFYINPTAQPGGAGYTRRFPLLDNIQFGKNCTAPEIILDMGIVKSSLSQVPAGVFAGFTPSNTAKIYAARQVFEGDDVSSFYYIDVEAEFQNSLVSQNKSFKHTIGLVSNYFNSASVTTGTSADSVLYTHYGQPLKLSSFTVNILNENRTSPSLGAKNFVFLELSNNQLALQQQQEQQEQQQPDKNKGKK
tara:strand:- start:318 stop:2129 length:1812 start_codon:yes stop_codon:yes gene_type:complete